MSAGIPSGLLTEEWSMLWKPRKIIGSTGSLPPRIINVYYIKAKWEKSKEKSYIGNEINQEIDSSTKFKIFFHHFEVSALHLICKLETAGVHSWTPWPKVSGLTYKPGWLLNQSSFYSKLWWQKKQTLLNQSKNSYLTGQTPRASKQLFLKDSLPRLVFFG